MTKHNPTFITSVFFEIITFVMLIALVILIPRLALYKSSNEVLSKAIIKQQSTIKQLNKDKQNLLDLNNELSEEKITDVNEKLALIEPLRLYDKKEYLSIYKNLLGDYPELSETIYDYTTDEEFNLICSVIEAEAGICDFNGKLSVANVIVNRYLQGIVSWNDVLFADNQFSTISNGTYKKAKISNDTKLALEYAFLFGDENTVDCLYFRSGDSKTWHDKSKNLVEVYSDKYHKFYREKGEK